MIPLISSRPQTRRITDKEMLGLVKQQPEALVQVCHDIGRGKIDKDSAQSSLKLIPAWMRHPAYNGETNTIAKARDSWNKGGFISEVEELLGSSQISKKARRPERISHCLVEGLSRMSTYCVAATSAGIGNGTYRVRNVLRELKKLERQMKKHGLAPHEGVAQLKQTFRELPQPFLLTDLAKAAKDGLKALIKGR